MNRHRIRVVFIGLFLLAACFAAVSQGGPAIPVADQFRSYSQKAIREKLFLHTDKEFYVAGEILWFRIYYVDGATHKPTQLSHLSYVEILNEKNEPVFQAKISLEQGQQSGSFYLPASLATGYYTVRAYTNWMRNFDASLFFEKKIAIVNTLKSSDAPAGADSIITIADFFPEGGNLVNGIESRVGFIVRDSKGGINDFHGYVLDKNGDTVSFFNPLKSGIGNFVFKPVTGNLYKAVIVLSNGSTINKALPAAYEEGYVMNVSENRQEQVVITVTGKGKRIAEQLTLVAHTRQVLSIAEKIPVNNDQAQFVVDKKRLGTGVTYFTVFDEAGKPLCERLFYNKPVPVTTINVQTDQALYEKRHQVSLAVTTANNPVPLSLSASVFYLDSLSKPAEATIVDYMWLASDLPGTIESPGYYFSGDAGVNTAIDNLMLTYGWRRFKWNEIAAGNDAFIKYLPEINGHLVNGRVTDSRNGQPVPDVNVNLSIPGNQFGFYTARSDKNGLVRFEIKDYYGNRQIIAQPEMEADSFYRVEIFKPYADAVSGPKYPSYGLTEDIRLQLRQRSIGMQVQNIYSGDSLRTFNSPVLPDTLPFFGKAKATYMLDDYKRFVTMEEVLREYVGEIGVGARNGKLIFKIFNPVVRDFYEGSSLVLLDGVPLADANKIFTYDPLKVRKLEVVQDRYVLGKSTFNGIASFSTYEGNFDGYELNPKLVAIDYSGLQLQREFYSPVYETKEQLESRMPDLRNTLFWNPSVNVGQDGKTMLRFYSPDRPGKYIVIVQGMSASGDFVAARTTFEVK